MLVTFCNSSYNVFSFSEGKTCWDPCWLLVFSSNNKMWMVLYLNSLLVEYNLLLYFPFPHKKFQCLTHISFKKRSKISFKWYCLPATVYKGEYCFSCFTNRNLVERWVCFKRKWKFEIVLGICKLLFPFFFFFF